MAGGMSAGPPGSSIESVPRPLGRFGDASLPTAQGIAVVFTSLKDPEEGLPVGYVAAALFQAFGMPAKAVADANCPKPLCS